MSFAEFVYNSLKNVCKVCQHPIEAHTWEVNINSGTSLPPKMEERLGVCSVYYDQDMSGRKPNVSIKEDNGKWEKKFACPCSHFTPYSLLEIGEVIERELGK